MRKTDTAGYCQTFQTSSNIHTIAQQVVTFSDHITDVDTNAVFNALLGRHILVAFRNAFLHSNAAAHGIHCT